MWFIGVEVEQETSAPPHKKILDPPLVLYYVEAELYKSSFKHSAATANLALFKSENRLGIGDFGNCFNGVAKSPRVLRSS